MGFLNIAMKQRTDCSAVDVSRTVPPPNTPSYLQYRYGTQYKVPCTILPADRIGPLSDIAFSIFPSLHPNYIQASYIARKCPFRARVLTAQQGENRRARVK